MLREPLLAQETIGSLAGQFRRLVRQVKKLKLRTGTERVGCYLFALSERQSPSHEAILPYEKILIAAELGMTRESYSRALAALRGDGVTVQDQTITIQDTKRLSTVCVLDPLIDDPEGSLPSPDVTPTTSSGKARSRRSHG